MLADAISTAAMYASQAGLTTAVVVDDDGYISFIAGNAVPPNGFHIVAVFNPPIRHDADTSWLHVELGE